MGDPSLCLRAEQLSGSAPVRAERRCCGAALREALRGSPAPAERWGSVRLLRGEAPPRKPRGKVRGGAEPRSAPHLETRYKGKGMAAANRSGVLQTCAPAALADGVSGGRAAALTPGAAGGRCLPAPPRAVKVPRDGNSAVLPALGAVWAPCGRPGAGQLPRSGVLHGEGTFGRSGKERGRLQPVVCVVNTAHFCLPECSVAGIGLQCCHVAVFG